MWLQKLHAHLPEAALAVLLCYAGVLLIRCLIELRRLPPGPYGLPWVGYLPGFGPGAFHQLGKLHQAFGDIVCFKALGNTIVVFNSYDTLYEAAVVNRRKVGRWTLTVNDWLAQGHGISNYDTPRALELRQALFRHLYGHEHMIAYLTDPSAKNELTAAIRNEINRLISELKGGNQKPIKVIPLIRRTIWRIMWKLVFGTVCEMENEVIEHMLQQISSNNMENTMLQTSQLLPKCLISLFKYSPYVQRLFHVDKLTARYKVIHQTLQQELQRAMKMGPMPGSLVSRFTSDERLRLQVSELRRLTFELMAAGTDTSSLTLTWAFSYIAAHPDQFTGPVDEKHMDSIHRCASVVPLALPHVARESMTVAGFHIPRHSMLIFNLYAVHQKQLATPNNKTSAIPFSLGSRSCPGGRFANHLLQDILQSITQQFTIEAVHEVINKPASVKTVKSRGLTRGPGESCFIFHPKAPL